MQRRQVMRILRVDGAHLLALQPHLVLGHLTLAATLVETERYVAGNIGLGVAALQIGKHRVVVGFVGKKGAFAFAVDREAGE